MRSIIFHYHYFKNAGSSIDAILQRNFGERWVQREYPNRHNFAAVVEWIEESDKPRAYSSHTAQFPVPTIEGVEIYPVLFMRHPIDRIGSAYAFERDQNVDTPAARLAREASLAGYIRARLDIAGDHQCRNFHATRMARLFPAGTRSELDCALDALRRLPFIGIVERFEESLARLQQWLKPAFPEFEVFSANENVRGERGGTLQERLAGIREALDDALYAELIDSNLNDIALYAAAVARFDAG